MLEALNVPADFVPLIREHYCTIRELQEFYSLEDAMDMQEIWAVTALNEAIAAREREARAGRR